MKVRAVAVAATLFAACSSETVVAPPPPGVDPAEFAEVPRSCAFDCPSSGCAESTTPYACPALGDWAAIAHDATCPAWDGKPQVVAASKCTASAASADAMKTAGVDPDDAARTILPDGRRVRSAGREWLFNEPELAAGFPVRIAPVPQSTLALVVDAGYGPHSVRLVDTALLGKAGSPVLSTVRFDVPEMLWQGLAIVGPDLALVATNDGAVQALKLDLSAKTIARDAARTIALPDSIDDTGGKATYFVSGLAVSPDAKTLVVASVFDKRVLVFDLSAGNYGKLSGQVELDAAGTFDVAFDPNDALGRYVYVSRISQRSVAEIDLSAPAAPKLTRSFATDKDPQGMAFLDARWLVVGNTFGDTLSVVDRVGGSVTTVAVDTKTKLHGQEPTTLAVDAAHHLLYATLSGRNAIGAWTFDATATPPKMTPAGRLPTSWWPSSVAVDDSGGLLWTSARGHGNGPIASQLPVGDGDGMHGVAGGIGALAAPQPSDLAQGEAAVDTNDDVGALTGAPSVTCPAGEEDFALPPTNTAGPSKKIKHIVFVVRENKTFDALMGDMKGVRGDPSLTMKSKSADMDSLFGNFRDVARTFATSDNYYTDAELSIQGHFWTVFGRSSDFMERTWQATGYSRSAWRSAVQPQCVSDVGTPQEGGLFEWLGNNHATYAVFGEACGIPPGGGAGHVDGHYPGGFIQSIGHADIEKACYYAGRLRVLCNIPSFVYMTLPNDHTLGVGDKTPSPETMVAVNDEATGMVVEALSKSPFWADSLVVVTEDDPSGGGDHIDHHRTPIAFASPWIKRGYVSPTHIDASSLHKMFAHILGLPYPNALVEKAALPLDMFSAAPDMTPFSHTARRWPLSCGEQSTLAEKALTGSWNLSAVDEQPGLGQQVDRVMRGAELRALTPAVSQQMQTRAATPSQSWRAR